MAHNKCCRCGSQWHALPGERGWRNEENELVAPCCGSKYWIWLNSGIDTVSK